MPVIPLFLPKALKRLKPSVSKSPTASFEITLYGSLRTLKRLKNLPSLVVLFESDYQFLQEEATTFPEEVGLILIEESHLEIPEDPKILGWLSKDASIRQWKFTINQASQVLQTHRSIALLQNEVILQDSELSELNEIGIALSSEKNIDSLLRLIIDKAMELSHADAASLYLIEITPEVEEDKQDYFKNKHFRFQIAKNQSRDVPFRSATLEISKNSIYGYVALTKRSLRIEDAYFIEPTCEYSWAGKGFDESIQYRTRSMLTIPMLNRNDEVIGVLQLINCKKDPEAILGSADEILDQVIPFTPHHVHVTQSLASQAAVALENARLIESIQNLFDGFINASIKAIESRDPTTSGHSGRVAQLTVELGKVITQCDAGTYRNLSFSEDQLQEISYAALLHDFGKIGVREEVLLKAKKLYPTERQALMDRFQLIQSLLQLQAQSQQIEMFQKNNFAEAQAFVKKSSHELKAKMGELQNCLDFIMECNEPTVLAQEGFEQLEEISRRTFRDLSGEMLPFLTESEVVSLSIPKGSLSAQDRDEIESHVTHTYHFLSRIPWTGNLAQVPQIAYAHHERLDGSGYPRKLKGDDIPIQAKMMTIADIYDALTAWDRPYKKALPIEKALTILSYEAEDRHIDSELLRIFIESKVYQCVAASKKP